MPQLWWFWTSIQASSHQGSHPCYFGNRWELRGTRLWRGMFLECICIDHTNIHWFGTLGCAHNVGSDVIQDHATLLPSRMTMVKVALMRMDQKHVCYAFHMVPSYDADVCPWVFPVVNSLCQMLRSYHLHDLPDRVWTDVLLVSSRKRQACWTFRSPHQRNPSYGSLWMSGRKSRSRRWTYLVCTSRYVW